MSHGDVITYHQRRAEQEVAAAAQASDSTIVLAHYRLLCLHLDMLAALNDEQPSQPFMLSSPTDDGDR